MYVCTHVCVYYFYLFFIFSHWPFIWESILVQPLSLPLWPLHLWTHMLALEWPMTNDGLISTRQVILFIWLFNASSVADIFWWPLTCNTRISHFCPLFLCAFTCHSSHFLASNFLVLFLLSHWQLATTQESNESYLGPLPLVHQKDGKVYYFQLCPLGKFFLCTIF